MPRRPPDPARLDSAILSLRNDRVLGEVAGALGAAAVDWILLKGPAVRLRLYAGATRDYRDLDLLVDPGAEPRAYAALESIGFATREGFGAPEGVAVHHEWTRGVDMVEVHVTLNGIDAPPPRVWEELRRRRRAIEVGDTTVWALDDTAMALHLALHAAQHGPAMAKGIEDLQRGLAQLPRETWAAASALAASLSAEPAFAAAMGLVSPELAAGVPVTGTPTPEALLRSRSANSLAIGLTRLQLADGPRARLRHVLRLLFPSRQFLRRWTSLDRGRALPYPVAYVRRMAYVLRHAPAGVIAWGRAVRSVRARRPPGTR
jgi:Uncharacterised nucleotidyltransferase